MIARRIQSGVPQSVKDIDIDRIRVAPALAAQVETSAATASTASASTSAATAKSATAKRGRKIIGTTPAAARGAGVAATTGSARWLIEIAGNIQQVQLPRIECSSELRCRGVSGYGDGFCRGVGGHPGQRSRGIRLQFRKRIRLGLIGWSFGLR